VSGEAGFSGTAPITSHSSSHDRLHSSHRFQQKVCTGLGSDLQGNGVDQVGEASLEESGQEEVCTCLSQDQVTGCTTTVAIERHCKEASMTPPTPFDNFSSDSEEYEEISSTEVDRVIQAIETLIQNVSSENIRAYLDEAADNIYSLIYDSEGQPCEGNEPLEDDARGEAA
jgi:hypothetical protein